MKTTLTCLICFFFYSSNIVLAQEYDPKSVIVKYKTGYSPEELKLNSSQRSLDKTDQIQEDNLQKLSEEFESKNFYGYYL